MLHRYVADRAHPLVARLAEILAEPPEDPMEADWLATPSDGMRRWVALELGRHLGSSGGGRQDGICANVVPAFADSLRRAVLAGDGVDWAMDPWRPSRLAWFVSELLADEPAAAPLRLPVSTEAARYGTARRIADHFDRYHLHRPAMVRAWAAGRDVDGIGAPVPADLRWQPRLWRAVRERIGGASAPERWPSLLERLRDGALALDLPRRLCVFGFSLLPTGDFLDLLSAVATTRDVHLFLLEPANFESPALTPTGPRRSDGLRPRADDVSASLARHPLLRSWGQFHRETAVLLRDAEARGLPPATRRPSATPDRDRVLSLLGRLQADVRANRSPVADLDPVPGDQSVRFHACYGPARQVAALRDAVLHLLAADPSLREEDVVVLCPALERFAPVIESVLGPSASAAGPTPARPVPDAPEDGLAAPRLRYRIVDQSVRTPNEMVDAALSLLDLVSGRFEAPAVLDFLRKPPVRNRFAFDEEDLAAIDRWVSATRVRWGRDPEHRERFDLPATVTSNTWQAAVDRLLWGSVVDGDGLAVAVGDIVPHPVESGAVGCLGRLVEALRALGELAEATAIARPVSDWLTLVRRGVRSLLAAPGAPTGRLEVVEEALDEALAAAGGAEPSSLPLPWTDLRRLLGEHLGARRGRNDFFRGGMTVTSLVPLRWVPFRAVCLIGMDQWCLTGEYPAGDDLVQLAPVVGDREARRDLRQALLEAVLAAEDHLLVFRDGHHPRTNQVVPQAVAVAELFESFLATVRGSRREEVERGLEVDHPCQPFDERYFAEGSLVDGVRWSFSRGDLEGARARRRRRPELEPFLDEPLAPVGEEVIELDDLRSFFEDPTGTFLQRRLGVRLPRRADRSDPVELPVHLGPLEKWQLGDRLLRARLDGMPVESWARHERGLGTVPPGLLGDGVVEEVEAQVEELLRAAGDLGVLAGPADAEPIDIELAAGTRVVGSVPLGLGTGVGAAYLTYSRAKPGHLLRAWLDLMALSLARPAIAWRSVVVSRREQGDGAASLDYVLAAPGTRTPTPLECLQLAVDLYRKGMAEPLPLFPRLSFDLCFHAGSSHTATWRSSAAAASGPGEGETPAAELVYGRCGVDAVLALPARPGDPGRGEKRAVRLAQALFPRVASSVHDQNRSSSEPRTARRERT